MRALSLNLVSLVPIIATLIRRISRNIQGMIILGLGGIFAAVWIEYIYLITGGNNLFLPLTIVLSFATMIVVGGRLLVYFSK